MLIRVLSFCFIVFFSAVNAFADDPYTVSNVYVDAQADTSIAAQTLAISQGYVQAANIMIKRLSLESERISKGFVAVNELDAKKMIRAQGTASEKRSSTRYIADITVSFNQNAVSQYMRAKGLTLVDSQSRKRLVIPVLGADIASETDLWHRAWADGQFANALTPIDVMSMRPGLESLIGSLDGGNLKLADLKMIGEAFGVEQILIAFGQPTYSGYSVILKDVALDSGSQRSFSAVNGNSALEAASKAVMKLEDDWKASTVTPISTRSVIMPVSVLYRNHVEWKMLQDAINGTAQIRWAKLEAISNGGAMMLLTYGGDMERLRNELSYKGVSLRTDAKLGTILTRTGYIIPKPEVKKAEENKRTVQKPKLDSKNG
ncbi:MAG: hypothetical protein V3U57_09295 [Robiginitomaculum sp.]